MHAQDRFWEMDFRRHVTSGRLSELFGESQLGDGQVPAHARLARDRRAGGRGARPDDSRRTTRRTPTASTPTSPTTTAPTPRSSTRCSACRTADYEIEPWTAADSVAWLKAMAWDLRANIEDETERALLAPSSRRGADRRAVPGLPVRPQPGDRADDHRGASAARRRDAASAAGRERRDRVDRVDRGRRRHRGRRARCVGGAGEGIGSNSWVVSGDAHRDAASRCSPTTRTSAPSLPSVWHQVGPEVPHRHRTLPVRRRRLQLLGRARRRHRPQRPHRVGLHEPHDRRHRPLPREGRGRPVLARRRARAARGAHRDDQGRGRRRRRRSTIRSTVHGPIVSGLTDDFTRDRRRPVTGTGGAVRAADRCTPAGEYAVSLRVDRAASRARRPRAIFALNRRRRTSTDFRARGGAVRRARAEPHLRRRRRQHRLPDARQAADPRRGRRLAAAARLGLRVRLDRASSRSTSCPSSYNPADGLHRHREQRDRRRGLPATSSRATGTTAGARRASPI